MDNAFDSTNRQHLQLSQLKKVKRPINRIMPQSSQNYSLEQKAQKSNQVSKSNPFQQQTLNNEPVKLEQTSENQDAFDLDAYLDEDANLPTKTSFSNSLDDFSEPNFIEEDNYVNKYYSGENNNILPPYLTKKILVLLGFVLFFVGILSGMFLFSEEKVVRNGLQGVVVNPEVPRGRARCGVAERTQGCVLYIMNPQRQELNARDFYDLASQLTGRQRFVIETGNMRYSNTKIKPGNIVQLNIPPL